MAALEGGLAEAPATGAAARLAGPGPAAAVACAPTDPTRARRRSAAAQPAIAPVSDARVRVRRANSQSRPTPIPAMAWASAASTPALTARPSTVSVRASPLVRWGLGARHPLTSHAAVCPPGTPAQGANGRVIRRPVVDSPADTPRSDRIEWPPVGLAIHWAADFLSLQHDEGVDIERRIARPRSRGTSGEPPRERGRPTGLRRVPVNVATRTVISGV